MMGQKQERGDVVHGLFSIPSVDPERAISVKAKLGERTGSRRKGRRVRRMGEREGRRQRGSEAIGVLGDAERARKRPNATTSSRRRGAVTEDKDDGGKKEMCSGVKKWVSSDGCLV
ncbi:hypothetical protein Syun_000850 [Stephania yunnanensis]|uniref:Uncharacterized protein n=1 Tax=Stephania yunnanensis TaxID=152371 RepID=A0AAP0LDR1_9MAGN